MKPEKCRHQVSLFKVGGAFHSIVLSCATSKVGTVGHVTSKGVRVLGEMIMCHNGVVM